MVHTPTNDLKENMFIALRDIRFAKGRFALIATVVAMITLLVGSLTGLTAGLANQNISSIMSLTADKIVLSTPDDNENLSYDNSSVSSNIIEQYKTAKNVNSVEPLGISRAKFINENGKNLNASIFGIYPSYENDAPKNANSIVLSSNAAKEADVEQGDILELAGEKYTVEKIGEESWYSHSSVVWVNYDDWSSYSQKVGQSGEATALMLMADDSTQDISPVEGTEIKTPITSLMALSAFKSEIGSLGMMIGMLFLISALVIGAFFTVWTIQRKGDIAIMKALGVSSKALMKDSLGQALIILVIGVGSGILATIGIGSLAVQVLPFVLSPLTMGIPVVAMVFTGLLGALFALRTVTKADPLTALASSN